MGGTTASPKTLRFFVPSWISNDSFLYLVYQVVEIELLESSDVDSLSLSRAVRSVKLALKNPPTSVSRQIRVIEDSSPTPSMLSPQHYVCRGVVILFSLCYDAYLSSQVGITVVFKILRTSVLGSLLELEKKQRVDVKPLVWMDFITSFRWCCA